MEYFDREEAVEVLEEWKRTLIPKGTLRVAVPDFETMARMYIETSTSLDKFLGPLYGRMDMGDKKIYHKNTTIDDYSFSKAVRQSLLHWGYKINQGDYDLWKIQNGY